MISAKSNATDTISSTLKVKFRNGMPLYWDGHGMSREEFYAFCVENHQLRIERNANGQLIIMLPTASETGHRNFEISIEIGIWNRRCKLGVAFDSSKGFTLPNGAERSPNTA